MNRTVPSRASRDSSIRTPEGFEARVGLPDLREGPMMYSVNRELVERLSIAPDAFTGQTALVAGGARGIGEATATTLAALGARVVVIDRLPAGEDVAAAIRAVGGDAVFKACDISDVDQLNDVIAQIGETVGAVDILINNALHPGGEGGTVRRCTDASPTHSPRVLTRVFPADPDSSVGRPIDTDDRRRRHAGRARQPLGGDSDLRLGQLRVLAPILSPVRRGLPRGVPINP